MMGDGSAISIQPGWKFGHPYIKNDKLTIGIRVIFNSAGQWYDAKDTGYGSGYAAVTDTYDKAVPLKVKYENKSWNAGEEQHVYIQVPLSDLDVDKPVNIYCALAVGDGTADTFEFFNFVMEW